MSTGKAFILNNAIYKIRIVNFDFIVTKGYLVQYMGKNKLHSLVEREFLWSP